MQNRKLEVFKIARKIAPSFVRRAMRKQFPLTGWDQYQRRLRNPYADEPPVYVAPASPYTIGIFYEVMHYHKVYIAACREMGISYKLIDLFANDWIEQICESGCDAYLVWPSVSTGLWKEMYDDRLRILVRELGGIIYPTYQEIWLYENKRRVRDWLEAREIPHPKTWIFYDMEEAMEFAHSASLPLVFKTNIGASHSGVWILRKRSEVLRMIKTAFQKGIVARGKNSLDKEWGVVYFQEYLPNIKEWRMMRIGHSYFGYRKEKVGDFHSGSGAWSWLDPPRELLDLLREITEAYGFSSMDIDFFETTSGDYLVNELQTVFGATTPVEMLKVDGEEGRYIYDAASQSWIFQAGNFSRNMCANARVDYLINHILPNIDKHSSTFQEQEHE